MTLQLLEVRALAAPNVWGGVPVLECRVICEPISDEWIDGVFQQLGRAPQSTLVMERRHFPTTAHALMELALVLQRTAECPVTFSDVRPTSFAHVWQVAFEIEEEPVGRAALEAACRLLSTAATNEPDRVGAHLAHVRELADRHRLDFATRKLVAAARRRGIPVMRLDEERLVQLGQGKRHHRLRMAATDRTSFIAEWISNDKLLTKRLLKLSGIPVAEGRQVMNAEDACRAADEIRAAVVVKPRDADCGEGVTVNLVDPSQIRTAYDEARSYSDKILVERYLKGDWHRLLIVAGQLVAAVRKEPPRVTGDGRRTLEELIAAYNADPRRGFGEEFVLEPVVIGATVLSMLYLQGYSLDSVPPAGATILLRPDAYLSSGATQSDVTDEVHPEIRELAINAAEAVGLDIAGVDVICEDVLRPVADQCCGVLEVNSEPSLYVHTAPACDPPRPVAEKIIESIFPAGSTGRIPVVVVIGDVALAKSLAELWRSSQRFVGFAARHQVRLNDRPLGEPTSVRAGVMALMAQRRLDAAVIHVTLAEILRDGFPIDRCDLLFVANLEEDALADLSHLSQRREEFERAQVMFLPPGAWADETLMNCDQERIRNQPPGPMAQVVWVSRDTDRPEWHRHLAAGGRGITRRDDQIVLDSARESVLLAEAEPCAPNDLFVAACRAWLIQSTATERPDLPNGSNSRRSA